MTTPTTWHTLPDGRIVLTIDGRRVATIRHEPDLDPPYATEAWAPDGLRSLRNFAALEDAKAHCERVVRMRPPQKGA